MPAIRVLGTSGTTARQTRCNLRGLLDAIGRAFRRHRAKKNRGLRLRMLATPLGRCPTPRIVSVFRAGHPIYELVAGLP